MSSIGKVPGGKWRVRWREGEGQHSRTFDTSAQAREYQQDVDGDLRIPAVPAVRGVPWVRAVFRAYVSTIPLGLYETREAAREHCLAEAEQHGADVTGAVWEPEDPQDPDGEERLQLPDAPSVSLYSVLPLDLLPAFDPDGFRGAAQ